MKKNNGKNNEKFRSSKIASLNRNSLGVTGYWATYIHGQFECCYSSS